jgi:hypothetical protein
MTALLALTTLQAALIMVRGGDDARCPTVRQVNEAIGARLPGVLVPPTPSFPGGALTLTLSRSATGEHRFAVTDAGGQVLLSRTLPPPGPARHRDCEALAETVAIVVDRYLQELPPQEALAASAPPPVVAIASPRHARGELFAGGIWKPSSDGPATLADYEARLGAGLALGASARFALELTAGIQGTAERRWDGRSGRLWRFPTELRLLWRGPAGALRVEVGPFVGLEIMALAGKDAMSAAGVYVAPVVGGNVALRFSLGDRAFLRLVGALGRDLLRYSFQVMQAQEAFGTDVAYAKLGLEAGLAFW